MKFKSWSISIILSIILCGLFIGLSDLAENKDVQIPESSRVIGDPKNIYGILLGIDDYPGTAMDLDYSQNDMDDFVDLVVSWNGQWGNSYYITKLYDEQVNKSNIEAAFATMANRVDSNDLFILYFSGLGTINPTLALCPYDTYDPSSSNYNIHYFTTNWLKDLLNSLKGTIMVILDANHSGAFVPHLAYNNRFIFAGSQPNEKAIERGTPYVNKIFTYAFCDVFNTNYDPNGDGYTSLKEASDRTITNTSAIAVLLMGAQTPIVDNQIGDNFKPALFNDRDGDGVCDTIELAQGTSEVNPDDNWKDNGLRLAANILTIIFLIGLPIIIVLMIYMHNEGYRQIPAAMDPFPPKQKLATPIDKDKVTKFNALTTTSLQPKSGNIRNPFGFFKNKGDPIIIQNPKEIYMPVRCIMTNEDLQSDKIKDFPIQGCIYTYPTASNIPEDQRKQYGIKVPISFRAKERMELSEKRNATVKKFAIIGFLINLALYILLSLAVQENFATILFWLILTTIIIVSIYSLDKIVIIDNYFMAIRLDAERIEIRIHDEDYRQIFKQLNKIE
jgi:hypothetical protein